MVNSQSIPAINAIGEYEGYRAKTYSITISMTAGVHVIFPIYNYTGTGSTTADAPVYTRIPTISSINNGATFTQQNSVATLYIPQDGTYTISFSCNDVTAGSSYRSRGIIFELK